MHKSGVAAICMAAILVLLHGCASAPKKDTAMSMAQLRSSYEELLSAPEDSEKGDRIISRARAMIGMPYVRGGRTPGGFDCSGLVQWAYKNEGISLPRTAREQSQVGTRITDVEAMRAGDIVAFRHPRRGYHTGIYVGDGKFIHSPHRRDRVKISSLSDPYFRTTFLGARRVSADAEAALDRARSRLEDSSSERLVEYREEQAVRELRKSRQERSAREKVSRSKKSRDKKERASSDSRRKKDKSRSVAQRDTKKKIKASSGSSRRDKNAKSGKSSSRKKVARDSSRKSDSRKSAGRSKSRKEASQKSSKKTEKGHKS